MDTFKRFFFHTVFAYKSLRFAQLFQLCETLNLNMMIFLVLVAIFSLAFNTNALVTLVSESGNHYYIETAKEVRFHWVCTRYKILRSCIFVQYTWYDALHECALLNKSLVSIRSIDKQQEFNNMLNAYYTRNLDCLPGIKLWLAGPCNTKNATPESISSMKEDNRRSNENCRQMAYGGIRYNDHSCNSRRGFICE